MHQIRQETSKLLPIPRKGTKYVAKANINPRFAVTLVMAVRDMLHLAKTAREVREMIKAKALKINGRVVYELNDAIQLFQIVEADKKYMLDLLPTGKFTFVETKTEQKLCKVINKTLLPKNQIQFNMHEGSNIISKDKINVGDTVYLSFDGKLKKHVPLEKGKDLIVFSGKYAGSRCKALSVENNKVTIKIGDKQTEISKSQVIAL